MRFLIMVCSILLSVFLRTEAQTFSAELKKTIGDDSDENLFFHIETAAILDDGSVFVGDSKGFFVAHYTSDGKLIKRFGRYGQGPNELMMIDSLRVYNDHVYFSDLKNHRIAKIDLGLERMDTIKLGYITLRGDFYPLANSQYLATFSCIRDSRGKGRVGIFDANGDMKSCFFTKDQWGEYKDKKDDMGWAIGQITAKVLAGYSYKWDDVVLGFEFPEYPELLYMYDLKGMELKKIVRQHKKGIHFPSHYQSFHPVDGFVAKEIHSYIKNQKYFCYKDYLLLFSKEFETRIKANPVVQRFYCSILDRSGRWLGEFDIPKEQKILDVNAKGMMVCSDNEEETPKLYVYQITF